LFLWELIAADELPLPQPTGDQNSGPPVFLVRANLVFVGLLPHTRRAKRVHYILEMLLCSLPRRALQQARAEQFQIMKAINNDRLRFSAITSQTDLTPTTYPVLLLVIL